MEEFTRKASEFRQFKYGVIVSESLSSSTTPSTSADEKLWLVKSGDRITGPITTSELIRKLKAKEVIIIDEIIEPNSRWKHIRDVAEFAGVVEEIRHGLMANKEDTEAGSKTWADDEKTPVTLVPRNSSVPMERRTNVAESSTPSTSTTSATDFRQAEVTSTAAASAKASDDRGIRSTQPLPQVPASKLMSQTLIWAAVAVAAALGGIMIVNSIQKSDGKIEPQDLSKVTAEAEFALKTGDAARASNLYARLAESKDAAPEIRLRDAILTLRWDRQTLLAKRKFEALLAGNSKDPQILTRARVGLALASQQSDDTQAALERLEKLSSEATATPLVLFNLAAITSEQGSSTAALKYLSGLDSHPQLGEASMLLRAMALTEAGEFKSVLALMNGVDGRRLGPYRFELLTLAAMAEASVETRRRSVGFLNEAWNADPLQGMDFYRDPLIYTEALRWERALNSVMNWVGRSRATEVKALGAIVMSLAEKNEEAEALVKELLATRPNDSHLLTAQAFLLFRLGRVDEARGALRFLNSPDAEKLQLAEVLRARICASAESIDPAGSDLCGNVPWGKLAASKSATVFAQTEWVRRTLKFDTSDPQALREAQALLEQLKLNFPESSLVLKLTAELSEAPSSR
jgi:hypothetical protein